MVVATDKTWTIPDMKNDESSNTVAAAARGLNVTNKELEIVEKSIESCYINGACERRKKPIRKIFRDVVYQPRLEDILEVEEEIAEIEVKFDLTLSALHRERALNSGCYTEDKRVKYRKKKYRKDHEVVERRPRSQTV